MTRLTLSSAPLLSALVLAIAVPSLAFAQEADLAGEQGMLERINALRAESELPPVERLGELDAVARAHTEEMARNAALAHVSNTSGTPEDRVRNAGVPAGAVTENVAMHADATRAHEALLGSPAHRGNMLNPAITHVGLSAIRADNAVYVTQLFVERSAPEPVAEAAPEAPADPVEAAAELAEQATAPAFGLIPPFVERAGEVLEAAPAVETPEPGPAPDAEPQAEAPAATDAPAIADAPAEPAPAAAAAPAQAGESLQQLVDIGNALLRAVTAPAAE